MQHTHTHTAVAAPVQSIYLAEVLSPRFL